MAEAPLTGHAQFVEISRAQGTLTARIVGQSLSQRETPIITQELMSTIDREKGSIRALVLDLSAVEFMSSIGLGMCVNLRNVAKEGRFKLVLLGLKPSLLELFKMVKLDKAFTLAANAGDLGKHLA